MFNPTTYVGVHTWLSLIAIASGVVVMGGVLTGRTRGGWVALFLATAILTSATGFGFPFNALLPSHVVGAIALLVLALALVARAAAGGPGRWQAIYGGCLVASLYFLVFVGVAQAFQKVPSLHALAPTGTGPAFAITQGVVLILFLALGYAAVRGALGRLGRA